jgi:FAD-dependent halogenase
MGADMDEVFDLIVVGAGPGGSTVATLVAKQGRRVLLLDRQAQPAYKIGESLLPSTVNGICKMLGVSEELKQANFVVKQGGTFLWGKDKEPWTFSFAMSPTMRGPTSFAYQVERIKFDAILLNNAVRHGVILRERHVAEDVLTDADGRVSGLVYRDADGRKHQAYSRFIVDASGAAGALGDCVGTRVYSDFFRNLAVFGYYVNGKRLPAPSSGNIFCAAFDRGWFWYIPLSARLTSVGAVIAHERADMIKPSAEAALTQLIHACEPIQRLLVDATRATDAPYDQIRVRKDFSYCHSAFCRPGLFLVGDAACFIDPVFSSGVHLSTYSALLAARSINTCLAGSTVTESQTLEEYEQRYRREYQHFHDFLKSFYDMKQDRDSYYRSAKEVLMSKAAPAEAFVDLVGGVAGPDKLPVAVAVETPPTEREAVGRGGPHVGPGMGPGFRQKLLRESTQIQLQAQLGENRPKEVPIREDGLIASPDGLHWVEAKRWGAA